VRRDVTRALAAVGVLLLAYQAWTIAGWITDKPHQINTFQDRSSISWYAAQASQLLVIVSIATLLVYAVREGRRESRIGTIGLLLIGMFTAGFWDPIYNWLSPAWLYTSNLLNVNDWTAHAPGFVNPEAGHQPWPIFMVLGYPLFTIAPGLAVCAVMRAVRRRHPSTSPAGLVAIGFAFLFVYASVSFRVSEALGIFAAPGYRLALFANNDAVVMGYSGAVVFVLVGCVLFFRDGDGRVFFDDRNQPTWVRVLSAIGACQLIVIVGWGLLTVPLNLYSSPYPELPRHIVSGLCHAPDTPGAAPPAPCPGGRPR